MVDIFVRLQTMALNLTSHFQNGFQIHNSAIARYSGRPKQGVLKLAVITIIKEEI